VTRSKALFDEPSRYIDCDVTDSVNYEPKIKQRL